MGMNRGNAEGVGIPVGQMQKMTWGGQEGENRTT